MIIAFPSDDDEEGSERTSEEAAAAAAVADVLGDGQLDRQRRRNEAIDEDCCVSVSEIGMMYGAEITYYSAGENVYCHCHTWARGQMLLHYLS